MQYKEVIKIEKWEIENIIWYIEANRIFLDDKKILDKVLKRLESSLDKK